MKQLLIGLLVFVFLVISLRCVKKHDKIIQSGSDTVTRAEIDKLPPESYQDVIDVYYDVLNRDPSLKSDSLRLGRAMYNSLINHPSKYITSSLKTNAVNILKTVQRVTILEWAIVFIFPNRSVVALLTAGVAFEVAKDSYACDGQEDGKTDAVRHAYWNILLYKLTGDLFTTLITTAHESEAESDSARAMDLHNNELGRQIARKYILATPGQLLEILEDSKFQYAENPQGSLPEDALVYFKNKQLFDGSYTGSITNPDSHMGPLQITLYFSQCGSTIRGQFTATRDVPVDSRRYNGIINGSEITLTVSEPYQFESVPGEVPCSDMKIQLTATGNTLSGSWTSSNCKLGGVLTVIKNP